jgi:hypothetical protein
MRLRFELILALVGPVAFAQGPQWQAAVAPAQQSGLHAIVLSPELVGLGQVGGRDLRLVDSTGQEVPYEVRIAKAGPVQMRFVAYPLLRNEALSNRTEVEFERPADHQPDELHIWIRPVEARKKVRITASDDRVNWYMLKDEHVVAQGARGDPPHQVLDLRIPRSDYRFYRITLNDSLTPPMQILGVGRFAESALAARYTEATVEWSQQDTASRTLLQVRSTHPVPVERITYAVADTLPYQRSGEFVITRNITTRKGRKETTLDRSEAIDAFTMGSSLVREMLFPGTHEDRFELVVRNGDDRPLRFTDLHVYQFERVLLTHLEKGMSYRFTTGDGNEHAPDYDLSRFGNALPMDTLAHAAVTAILKPAENDPAFDPSQWWIWAVIVALMAGMGWMALRMLRRED